MEEGLLTARPVKETGKGGPKEVLKDINLGYKILYPIYSFIIRRVSHESKNDHDIKASELLFF